MLHQLSQALPADASSTSCWARPFSHFWFSIILELFILLLFCGPPVHGEATLAIGFYVLLGSFAAIIAALMGALLALIGTLCVVPDHAGFQRRVVIALGISLVLNVLAAAIPVVFFMVQTWACLATCTLTVLLLGVGAVSTLTFAWRRRKRTV